MKNFYCKKMVFVFVILMGFVFTMWCTGPSVAEAQKQPVKIGVLTSLSLPGPVDLGKRILWGTELGIKYVNEKLGGVLGGRPLELFTEDDACTPADGIAGYRKLVQKDGVVVVMGGTCSSVCLAVAQLSKEIGVPFFNAAGSSGKLPLTQSPTFFSIMAIDPVKAKVVIDFAKGMGFKRVAVMAEDTDFGTGWDEWVRKHGADAGMEVKSIVYPRAGTDFTPSLLTIKAWKPDILINAGNPPASYLMTKQASDIGLFPQVPMLGAYDWPTRKECLDALGNKGKYILFVGYYKPGMKVSPVAEWMIQEYKKLHNEDPPFYTLNAFGEVLVVAQALNLAKSDDPKALTKALTTGTFQDWSGPVKFEETSAIYWHTQSPEILILQITEVRQTAYDTKIVWPLKVGDGKIVRP